MTYDQAVRQLMQLGKELASPRQARGQKFGLGNIAILAEALGAPQNASPCVHIAGTNGKGSTAATIESILRFAGGRGARLRTGMYTSPHLERINERIRIDGAEISDEAFTASFARVAGAIERLMASGALSAHPSYFECLTAMAFVAFAEARVDFAVYEVGMGGRFDATNIVTPEVAVITQIEFDHEDYLGHSIEEIAGEKAGIIKPGGWVVSSADRPEARGVIARRAAEVGARLIETDVAYRHSGVRNEGGCYSASVAAVDSAETISISLALPGRFQVRNAVTAVATARLLAERSFPVSDENIARGIAAVCWPGRLERLAAGPAVFLDGAHNPAGAREVLAFWEENFRGRKIFLVYGAMRDKAVDEIAGLLFPRAQKVILTAPQQPRAISAALLADMTGHLAGNFEIVAEPSQALERALELAGPEDAVFATGSLYLVGDLRRYWAQRAGTPMLARSSSPRS